MTTWLLPLLFATIAWFVSTGAILWLNRRSADTHPASMVGATGVAGLAFAAILISAQHDGAAAVYVAFFAAVAVWGWHEMSFLMGFVTGPRRLPCPEGVAGWRRFRFATATLIHHEIALALTAALLILITWNQPNPVAGLTFLLLFMMRLSTKFNIFLGVPHLADEMMPAHLAYLKSYFRKGRINALMPVSAVCTLLLALYLALGAANAPVGSGEAVGYALLFSLAMLALVEHVFLMVPFRDPALWNWALPKEILGPGSNQGMMKGSADGL
jgi:putative photosynthetic complex assembly protein 2